MSSVPNANSTGIASGPAKEPVVNLKDSRARDLYPTINPSVDAEVAQKLQLVMRADKAARDYDPMGAAIKMGMVGVADPAFGSRVTATVPIIETSTGPFRM